MKRLLGLSIAAAALGMALGIATATHAATVAYWRFEDGTAGTDVTHIAGTDNTFSADILDVSGNGNHLSTWNTGGCCGYQYRADVAGPTVPGTGAANTLSVKNTGGGPGMFTNASVSNPTGVNIDTMMPTAFTIEASWKLENGGYRTLVGRDARNVATSNGNLAALYLQARPNNVVGILFVDAAGNIHEAFTPENYIQSFDFGTDPDGLNAPWYHFAGVSDGSTLNFYVNGDLAASSPITTTDARLAIGTDNGGDWHAGGWSVGRGLYGGGHTDRGYGFIDEVRISDSALLPGQLLYAAVPEPGSVVILLLGGLFMLPRSRGGK
jgi:hypothetical protein